jgi:hypothetical protein
VNVHDQIHSLHAPAFISMVCVKGCKKSKKGHQPNIVCSTVALKEVEGKEDGREVAWSIYSSMPINPDS